MGYFWKKGLLSTSVANVMNICTIINIDFFIVSMNLESLIMIVECFIRLTRGALPNDYNCLGEKSTNNAQT